MKKNTMKDQEQTHPRRLGLNRETIRVLNAMLLDLARGGEQDDARGDCPTISRSDG